MNNSSSSKWILFLAILTLSLYAKADLPTLRPGDFPKIFNSGYTDANIDIDGNGILDYTIECNFSASPPNYCYIRQYSATGNEMLVEYVTPPPPHLPLYGVSNPPLSITSPVSAYAALLDAGYLISGTGNWDDFSRIFYLASPPPQPALASNFTTPKKSGYIGLQFSGNGGTHFGWLHVVIADDLQSVTIGQGGSGSEAGQSVQAGSGGSAVPIPILASILGFGLIGGGLFLKRRKKK